MLRILCYLSFLMQLVSVGIAYQTVASTIYQDYTADELVESQETTWANATKHVLLYISNRQNRDTHRIFPSEVENITSASSFNISLKTVFLIHGWHSFYNSKHTLMLGNAFLDVRDVNIVYVDWNVWAHLWYFESITLLSRVGEYVGKFINDISARYNYSLENVELVGHSLGAHICGYIGNVSNGAISSITGLDPAGIGFWEHHPEARLSPDDAQYVQAIHTETFILGVRYLVGDADYFPNGGWLQPGCFSFMPKCDHDRSYLFYIESLHSEQFIAKRCNSYIDYLSGHYRNDPQIVMGGPIVNKTLFGKYCLETNDRSPFALGDLGL